jgi:hypothetical protein
MNKFKVSKKHFKGDKVLSVGYCQMSWLLNYQEPIAYSTGIYGWACDYYDIDGVVISTGYQPIGVSVDYNLIKSYENKARLITHSVFNHEQRKNAINMLLKEFINQVKGLL